MTSTWVAAMAEATSSQEGLVSTAQLRAAGVTDSRIARLKQQGVIEPVTHGVWSTPLAPPDWEWRELRAAWIRLDPTRSAAERCASTNPRGVVRGRSAALLWGVGALDADEPSFAVWGSRMRSRQAIHLTPERDGLTPEEWCVRHGLPVTTLERTVSDLAKERIDGDHLERIAADAVLLCHADPESLTHALTPHARWYGYTDGAAMMQEALLQRGPSPVATWLQQSAGAA